MDKVKEFISDQIELVEISSKEAPYLQSTFTKWRDFIYKKHSVDPLEFAHLVDDHYLSKFLRKVTAQYYKSNLEKEKFLDLPEATVECSEEYSELAAVMARWSAELELAIDTIERARLYGLYEVPEGLQDMYKEMNQEWHLKEEPKFHKLYRFLLKLTSYGAHKLADWLRNSITGIISVNFAQSKSMILSSAVYAYFSGVFPWPLLALLGTQMSWVLGAWLVQRVGSSMVHKLDSAELAYHINDLKHNFETLLSDLMLRNEESKQLIKNCFIAQSKPEKENAMLELAEHLNGVLLHKEENVLFQEDFDYQRYLTENTLMVDDDDWVVIDPPEIKVESLEDSWTLIEM